MAVQLRCTDCNKAFRWKPDATGKLLWPDQCPFCGVKIGGDRDDSDVVMPFIRSAKTTNNDKLYRDMEKGSEVRAELAAQAAGCDVSEMSGLKMTDMKDNQREGDIAAKLTPEPDLGQHFKSNGFELSAGTASGAVNVNGQVTTGIEPRAGMKAMSNIQGIMGRSV